MSIFLYNPDRKSKQQLIAEFAVRTQVLDEIMHDLENSDMKTPEQHYLLVGQRGTGKTTLLHRVKYAIEDAEKLNTWLIPVIFSEEQYNISELANLWESIGQVLEDYHGFEQVHQEMEQHLSKENFEEMGYEVLEKHLEKHKRKLVLLVDNVGDLLKKMEDKEIRRFREILQTKEHLRVIAASPFYLDSMFDYKQPFFEFFKVKRLDGLNKEETEKLLLNLGEVYNEKEKIERILKETPERVETLRILTGGVPRTIALMFRIFVDHEQENSIKDMERILDVVTPLYKHRMDDLPAQQQKIVDAVARNWDAISVKELKEKTRLNSKIISAQLNQLEKNQVIEKRTSKTKNHLYLIRERFWNIWYLMRYGRKHDKERVIWLIRFLECWFGSKELEQRVTEFIRKIQNKELSESTIELFSLVYTSMESIAFDIRMNLQESLPETVANVIQIDNKEIFTNALKNITDNKFKDAIEILRKIKRIDLTDEVLLFSVLVKIPTATVQKYLKYIIANAQLIKQIDFVLVFLLVYQSCIIFGLNPKAREYKNAYRIINESFVLIKKFLKVVFRNNDTEFFMVDILLKKYIVNYKMNLAHEFFTGEDADYFKSKLEISYILVDYYRKNQDEAVLLRVPDEKKQIILQEIEKINKERNTFKSEKNN